MSVMGWIVLWGVVALVSSIVGGLMAARKHRDHSFWAAWSFIFPPALLLLLWLPHSRVRPVQRRLDDEDHVDA